MDPALMEHYTDDLKADPVAAPILDSMNEKTVPEVLKSYAHSQHRLRSAVMLPGKDATPDQITAVRAKLYEAGVFTAPPKTPEDYGVVKPASMAEGLSWNEETAKEFAGMLHKHGASKELGTELVGLHEKMMTGVQSVFKTSTAEAETALKTEFGDKYEERKEQARRITTKIFTTPEEMAFYEKMGLGDHPGFLGPLMRLAPLAMQDSSFLSEVVQKGGIISGEEAKKQLADIMNNKDNPRYAGHKRGDKEVEAYIDKLYVDAYGTGKQDLAGGVQSGPLTP